jgi:hypothetical protein
MRLKRPLPATRGARPGEPATLVVSQVGRADAGSIIIAARCASGTLALGAVFVLATEAVVSVEQGELTTRHTHPRAVSLSVDEITAYGRTWKTLASGMTAVVSLSGSGGDSVGEGDVLHTVVLPTTTP